MTLSDRGDVGSSNVSNHLPSPQALLRDTQWVTLDHALGSAGDTPDALNRLLATDPMVVAQALRHLEQTVHHQNSIYSATVPTALYVAAILTDQRTEAKGIYRSNDLTRPLRAVLLDWLGELADDVSDAAATAMRRHGFSPMEERSEMLKLRTLRPVLYAAVAQFLNDPDVSVRDAAVIAAALLLDDAQQIRLVGLISHIHQVAGSSSTQRYRLRATDLLIAYGDPQASLPGGDIPF